MQVMDLDDALAVVQRGNVGVLSRDDVQQVAREIQRLQLAERSWREASGAQSEEIERQSGEIKRLRMWVTERDERIASLEDQVAELEHDALGFTTAPGPAALG